MTTIGSVIEQLRTWALETQEQRSQGLIFHLRKLADDLEERKLLLVQGLPAFEECGVYDREIQAILDDASRAELVDAGGNTIARKDPETEDIWIACWSRTLREQEPVRDHLVRWRMASWPAGRWHKFAPMPYGEAVACAKRLIRLRKTEGTFSQAAIQLLDSSGTTIHNETDLGPQVEVGVAPS